MFPRTMRSAQGLAEPIETDSAGTGPIPRRGQIDLRLSRGEKWLILFLSSVGLLLGFSQAWHSRFIIGHGPVSYLDLGDAFFRDGWKSIVNGYFTPLYPILLGALTHWIRPTPHGEYPLVHLLVFGFYGFAFLAFSFFLRELIRHRIGLHQSEPGPVSRPRPALWVWLLLGYTIFLWSSLDLIEVSETNPDMLIAAFFYLAAGLLLRIRSGTATWPAFLGFGAVLGLGYLTKSAFFPMALIFLGVALFAAGNLRTALPRIAVSGIVFALIAIPYILALSIAERRPTFGDAGRLVYAWNVNDVPIRHWQGSSGDGSPLHPTRQVLAVPATYEFAEPIGGTYPVTYDPSYWYDGLKTRFSLRRQLAALEENTQRIGEFFLRLNGSLLFGIVALAAFSGRARKVRESLRASWFLLVPAIAGLGMYALVGVFGRYVGPFVATVFVVAFAAIPLPESRESGRLIAAVAVFAFAMLVSPIGPSTIPKYYVSSSAARAVLEKNLPWHVADEVAKLGLHPGDRVASLSYSKNRNMAWARLAKVKIVAEVFYSPTMPETFHNEFWKVSPEAQNQVLDAFTKAGAKIAVSDQPPPSDLTDIRTTNRWQRLGHTDFYACLLPRSDRAAIESVSAPQTR